MLDQGIEYTAYSIVSFLPKGVGNENDREDCIILEVTKIIRYLLQVKEKFYFFGQNFLYSKSLMAVRR